MANVEESDVAAECEYRKEKGVAKWHEKFLVEYPGGRKTEGRKCIKCNVLIKSIGPNSCSSSNIWPKPNPNSKGTIRPKSNIE